MSYTHPTLAQVRDAHARIRPYIHRTPVLSSRTLNEMVGAEVFFKCENFQKVGAFKARGACNAVMSLDDAAAKQGVVTHSSGNHGAALAWAARLRAIRATVVVPENAPEPKKRAIAAYGATIVYCAPTVAAREAAVEKLIADHGYTLIHPFDNEAVIAGQGTAVLELLEEQPDLDVVVSPLGGGGLLSGTAIAAHGVRGDIAVYGAEPRGADDGYRSLSSGERVREMTPNTICDGLRTVLSDRTFDVIRNHVAGIGVAADENIVKAMRMIWERLKIVVEPSACPPLAAMLEGTIAASGKRVGIILSGGNLDLDRLPWAITG
ncbi:MAG: pyridoxal-phosphate dependent enzyme [Betaproteobacteria bacterium]|nr:pyridoxal-phosphate dependent enzyme [Betaproteobacteria bacterium]